MYQDESNPLEESEGIGDTQICKTGNSTIVFGRP